MTIEKILEMAYLDYVNNYLTVSKFAEDMNMDEHTANIIINAGREINQKKDEKLFSNIQ